MKFRLVIPRVFRARSASSDGEDGHGRPRWATGLEWAAWIVGGGAIVGTVFAVSFYFAMIAERRTTAVSVPDVVGLTLDAASKAGDPLGLVFEVVDQRNDPALPSGRVLQQMPPPGSSVRRGRKIRLVLSLGGRVLEVPNLVGHASRAVELELRQEGFVPGDEARVPLRTRGTGTVAAQVPPPDTPAVPGTRVHRLVSDGTPPATYVMPDLTGLTEAQAERFVEGSGFRRAPVRRVRVAGRPSGTVIGQLPLAGYPIRARDVVELTVAR